jgi:heat shock protein HslJ
VAGIRLVAVVLALGLLGACGRSALAGPLPRSQPASAWPKGHSYTSTAVTEGGRDRPLVAGTAISVSLRDPGEVSVRAGCNELTVKATLQGNRIVPDNLVATAKGCPPDLLAQDAWIQHFFESGPLWRLTGLQLTLTAGTAEIRLSDDSDRPLLGTRWVVVSRTSGAATTSVPSGVAYVIFTRTGLVGETGCSGLAATATVHGGTISIEPVHRSDIPCGGVVSELDAAVMGTLHGEVQYRIKGTELVLSGSDGSSLTLRAQDDPTPTVSPSQSSDVDRVRESIMDGPVG